jgi:hypothetical protein
VKKIIPGFFRKVAAVETDAENPDPARFSSFEVDAILDKISAAGGNVKILTAKERAILEAASKKKLRS